MCGKKKKKQKNEIVADRIIEEIRKGRWNTGDKLPSEADLVQEFDISRVSLREGLKRLNVLGILRIQQGDGTYVNEIDVSEFMKPLLTLMSIESTDVDEIYTVRKIVQGEACRLAAIYRTDEDVSRLDYMVSMMQNAIDMNDEDAFVAYDRKFHNKIARMSGNRLLVMMDEMFRGLVDDYVRKINSAEENVVQIMLDHRQILHAIRDGYSDYAREIMYNHMIRANQALHLDDPLTEAGQSREGGKGDNGQERTMAAVSI